MAEHPLACAEWQGHLGAWLVAQLAPDDEMALSGHLRTCPTCSAEADSLLAVAAVSLGADPGSEAWSVLRDDAPPADLADRILARVATERHRSWARRGAVAVGAVAAAIVLALLLGRDDDPAPATGEPVTFAQLAPGIAADAVVAPDGEGSQVRLTATGLDPDLTYALWLTPPGAATEAASPPAPSEPTPTAPSTSPSTAPSRHATPRGSGRRPPMAT
jgi:hypothetical protein